MLLTLDPRHDGHQVHNRSSLDDFLHLVVGREEPQLFGKGKQKCEYTNFNKSESVFWRQDSKSVKNILKKKNFIFQCFLIPNLVNFEKNAYLTDKKAETHFKISKIITYVTFSIT